MTHKRCRSESPKRNNPPCSKQGRSVSPLRGCNLSLNPGELSPKPCELSPRSPPAFKRQKAGNLDLLWVSEESETPPRDHTTEKPEEVVSAGDPVNSLMETVTSMGYCRLRSDDCGFPDENGTCQTEGCRCTVNGCKRR